MEWSLSGNASSCSGIQFSKSYAAHRLSIVFAHTREMNPIHYLLPCFFNS